MARAHREQRYECHEEMLRHPEFVIEEILIDKTPWNEATVVSIEHWSEDDLLETMIKVGAHLADFLSDLNCVFWAAEIGI